MNIRSVSNPALILAQEKVEEKNKNIKSDQATDRDANGQQAFGDSEPKPNLSEEEFDKVLKMIQDHSGIKDNGLKAIKEIEGNRKFVVVYGPEGQLIKRIAEPALAAYLEAGPGGSFALVSKTA